MTDQDLRKWAVEQAQALRLTYDAETLLREAQALYEFAKDGTVRNVQRGSVPSRGVLAPSGGSTGGPHTGVGTAGLAAMRGEV